MKIEIKNLGQVKSASFEDAELTVIVGDNGSGKTLLLEATTFIINFYKIQVKEIMGKLFKKYSNQFDIDADWENVKEFIEEELEEELEESHKPKHKFEMNVRIDEDVLDEMNNDIKKWFEELKKQTINKLNREILMVDESKLDFNLFINPRIPDFTEITCTLTKYDERVYFVEMYLKGSNYSNTFSYVIEFKKQKFQQRFQSIESFFIAERKDLFDPINDLKNRLKNQYLFSYFNDIDTYGKILYLPSERNLFIDNALTKTLNEAQENIYSSMPKKSKSRYSEHLFNIDYLEYKDTLSKIGPVNMKIDSNLEEIFGGEINYDEEGDIKSIKQIDGKYIKRELFSTKQNRLIPYLILSNPLERYYKVIIEEPEAHLSLKSIRELLDYFKNLIKSGTKIIITTHSDVFFSYLNNLILTDKNLSSSKVYELKFSNGESILEEKNKTEFGYKIDLFSNELNNLYEETLDIQNTLEPQDSFNQNKD
ncbi:AAA family ATPase [Bacillus altitudinis]|uniref:AAA family ATPase n=1 Tax=Bacillus altitudinis TaxID=293387 RepID=UPI0015E8036B|nr:AAA family ATPase [Bacillus altitudinis]